MSQGGLETTPVTMIKELLNKVRDTSGYKKERRKTKELCAANSREAERSPGHIVL
jgi:hypothetical protein